jgi:hypothetical protein
MPPPNQATPYVPLTMYCRNPECGQPIPLPDPRRQEKFANLLTWSKDNWTQPFLCIQCVHAYDYSGEDVHPVIEGIDDPRPEENFLYRFSYGCDWAGCGLPTTLLVVAGKDEGMPTVYERVVSSRRLYFQCRQKGVPHNSQLPIPPPPIDMKFLLSF